MAKDEVWNQATYKAESFEKEQVETLNNLWDEIAPSMRTYRPGASHYGQANFSSELEEFGTLSLTDSNDGGSNTLKDGGPIGRKSEADTLKDGGPIGRRAEGDTLKDGGPIGRKAEADTRGGGPIGRKAPGSAAEPMNDRSQRLVRIVAVRD